MQHVDYSLDSNLFKELERVARSIKDSDSMKDHKVFLYGKNGIQTTEPDERQWFIFRNLPPDTYTVVATIANCPFLMSKSQTASDTITFVLDRDQRNSVALEPSPYKITIHGSVIDADNRPIRYAKIIATQYYLNPPDYSECKLWKYETITDEKGSYTLQEIDLNLRKKD